MAIGITYFNAYYSAEIVLRKTAFSKLTAIREIKKRHVEDYFQSITRHISFLAETSLIKNAAKEFISAFNRTENDLQPTDRQIIEYSNVIRKYYENEFPTRVISHSKNLEHTDNYLPGSNNSILLQYYYIANNPHPKGQRNRLVDHANESEYSRTHSKFHPVFNDFLTKFSLYDIFLVDNNTGNIVYSTFKEVDFSTNLITGKYRNTNLAIAFKEVRNSKTKGLAMLTDFKKYEPSYFEPAAFIATTITDEDGKNIATLLFQISADDLDKTMTGNNSWIDEGLGKTGETYLIGDDFKMRTNSRFFIEDAENYLTTLRQKGTPESTINSILLHSTTTLFQEVYTEPAKEVFKGNSDTRIAEDYRGVSVLSSYTELNIEGVSWAILSQIDEEEVFLPVIELRNRTMMIALGVSLLVIVLSVAFSRIITRPIHSLIEGLRSLGQGDFSNRVEVKSSDEIGQLSKFFNQAAEDLQKMTLLSTTDSLTKISNRRRLEEVLRNEVERAKRYHQDLSLIMFDIDYFKKVNDNYGHDVGDLILKEIALLVKETIRKSDIFARWGGEEFMILTPNTDLDNAKKLAEKARVRIEDYPFSNIKNLSCSFGACQFREDYDIEVFTKKVDCALYLAKDKGRNRVEGIA